MSIWNKVLAGLICVAALAFFYLSLRALKTHQYWRELAEKHQRKIAALETENKALLAGTEDENRRVAEGIAQVKIELEKLLLDRGRAWYDCAPQRADAQTGQVQVGIDAPDPHGIAANTVLYVFEQKDVQEGGQYLGEFKATAVDAKQVTLEPAQAMTPEALQRLSASTGPWVIYDVMPIDNPAILEGLSEQELRALMPDTTEEDYVRHGQPATWEDVDAWKVRGSVVDEHGVPMFDDQGRRIAGAKGVFHRQLRDYRSLLELYHKRRTILVDLKESAERDLRYITAAVDDANKQIAFHQQEIAALKADLAKFRAERDAVLAHEKAVEQKLGELRGGIQMLVEDNRNKAAQIARIQLDAARKIDARTRAMAQTAEGAE